MTFIDNHDIAKAIFITQGETPEMKNNKIKLHADLVSGKFIHYTPTW